MAWCTIFRGNMQLVAYKRYCFFFRKILNGIDSIQLRDLFFFVNFMEEKKCSYIFFSQKSLKTIHSPEGRILVQKVKKIKIGIFDFFLLVWKLCVFFPNIFFYLEKCKHHLLILAKEKTSLKKKFTQSISPKK